MDEEVEAVASPRRGVGQALVLYSLCLALMLSVGAAVQTWSLIGGMAITQSALFLLPAVAFVGAKRVGLIDGLQLRPPHVAVLALSTLAACATWAGGTAVELQMIRWLGPPLDMGLGDIRQHNLALLLFVMAVLPGFCEEALFRGVLQGVLERHGRWFAILSTGLLFGLFHLMPSRILPTALLGMVFGWLVVRTGSLWPAVVAHAANNGLAFTWGRLNDEAPSAGVLTALALVGCAALAGVHRLTRETPAEPGPLTRVSAAMHWLPTSFAMTTSLIVIGSIACVLGMVASVESGDDLLAPRIEAGDTLLVIKRDSVIYHLSAKDTIVLRERSKYVARLFVRLDGESHVVQGLDGERSVDARDVVGEVVRVDKGQE